MPSHAPVLSVWCLLSENHMENINHYLNRRTIIVGDVNSGKSSKTLNILNLFLKAGLAEKTAVLDLAPGDFQGIGGKMEPPRGEPLLYLTTPIFAPRLTGKDECHTLKLAEKNAMAIEKLFKKFKQHKKDILFINDVTLYFQAGDFERFVETFDSISTHVINAYYGHTFSDSELTRREKNLTEKLMQRCDQIIEMSIQNL